MKTLLVTAVIGAALVGDANAAHQGWQKPDVFDVQTGLHDLFFHKACPRTFPIPVSGSFRAANDTTKQGLTLTGNFRRDDAGPVEAREWGWIIDWSAGAPSSSQLIFNVYCTTKD